MVELINLSWIVALLAIISLFFVPVKFKAVFTSISVICISIITSWIAIYALTAERVDLSFSGGALLGDIGIRVDSLSAWFILIINFTSVTGVLFGTGYLKAYENPAAKLTMHWALFILFQLSMIFVCLVQNGLVFLIVWEIMSLSSMMLVIFDHHTNETLKAGINYMIQMHISVVLLTVGFIWVYFETGSFSFDSIGTFFQGHNNIWLFLIFFIGFGFKAGFIPFHSWLPHAHPATPSHISGVMSGVIVKLGIYGIIRMISYLHSDLILLGEIILTVSVLTGLYGILNAAVHRDFKR